MTVALPAVLESARGGGRIVRAAVTSLSALGEARLHPARRAAEQARALSTTLRQLCTIHRIEVEVVGELPDWPCLLVANHVSYLDPLVILSRIAAVPVAKGEVATWPLVGPAAQALGVRFVDRGAPMARARVLRNLIATLAGGTSVLNFAEGTTTDGRRLLPFHRGGFGAAMIAGVPVVPLALTFDGGGLAWTGSATFLPHYWQVSTRRSIGARLEVLPALWPRAGERAEALAQRVHLAIGRIVRARAPLPAPEDR